MHVDRQSIGVDALSTAIRQQIDHVSSAIAVLVYVTSLNLADIAKLRKSNVEHNSSRVEFNGNIWKVPEPLRAPLAMCRDRYGIAGYTGNTRLFLKDQTPFEPGDVEVALQNFYLDTGCHISPGRMDSRSSQLMPERLIDRHLNLVPLDGRCGLG